MSPSIVSPAAVTILTIATTFAYIFWAGEVAQTKAQTLHKSLPDSLQNWRLPGDHGDDVQNIWNSLEQSFLSRGLTLWPHSFFSVLKTPGLTYPCTTGFQYAISDHKRPGDRPGTVEYLRRFQFTNALSRAARTPEGHDVIVRVIVIRNQGHDHLKILRRFATGEKSFISTSHILPMFQEMQFGDIIFGIFPKVGSDTSRAYNSWAKNSVGDILDMILQSLEALAFIHEHRIAHRDAFHDNFLVQWHPESLLTNKISVSRPRVYLIDFEVAIQFAEEIPEQDCVTSGLPIDGSLDEMRYGRPLAPEFNSGELYSPFKLDVWQYALSISNFKTTLPEIDEILMELLDPDPVLRMSSKAALDKLSKVVHSMPSNSLHIAPVTTIDYEQ